MAHPQQLMFVSIISDLIQNSYDMLRVLEIGSYDVSGSIRRYFNNYDYTGCDLIAGPGVDIVASGHELDYDDETFDITISSECFEHNPFWVNTFKNMYRMTKVGGAVVVTCASRGRAEHGTTRSTISTSVSPGTSHMGWEYYKNLNESDFKKEFKFDEMFECYYFNFNKASSDLYFIGVKKGGSIFDIDLDLLDSKVREINKKVVLPSSGRIIDFFETVYKFPINVASLVLDDVNFQNFRIAYLRYMNMPAGFVKRIIGKK